MTHERNKFIICVAAACSLLGTCSAPPQQQPEARQAANEPRPSEADMRAARLLSLSNNSALDAQTNPYDLAVTCIVAINALSDRVRSGAVLNDQQKQALVSAKRIYERKAIDAGDKTRAELARDVAAAEAASDDARQRLLAAVSCIRQIA